jgi:hypothetical protein
MRFKKSSETPFSKSDSGANPTTSIYNDTGSLARFKNFKKYITLENVLAYCIQGWRCR